MRQERKELNPDALVRDLVVGACIGAVVVLVRLAGWALGAWETVFPQW